MTDKESQFVWFYYRKNTLDTRAAIRRFEARTHFRRHYRWQVAAAVACIAAVIGCYLTARTWLSLTEYAAGETPRTCLLPDGTSVHLAPHATITFRRISPRSVRMNGTAYFEVVPDPDRPFDIEGRLSHVRVLGTKFQVAESEQSSQIYVTQGKVLFTARDRKEGLVLTRGMSATLQKGSTIPSMNDRPAVNMMAWKTHILHFDNTPIADVLTDVGSFYGVKLHTVHTDKRFTGDIHTGSLAETIELIEQTLDINIEQQ